jgi:hypothetical protein
MNGQKTDKQRFCTSCQATKDELGGEYRRYKRTARWVCQGCKEHKSESIYKSTTIHNAKAHQRLLMRLWGAQ